MTVKLTGWTVATDNKVKTRIAARHQNFSSRVVISSPTGTERVFRPDQVERIISDLRLIGKNDTPLHVKDQAFAPTLLHREGDDLWIELRPSTEKWRAPWKSFRSAAEQAVAAANEKE